MFSQQVILGTVLGNSCMTRMSPGKDAAIWAQYGAGVQNGSTLMPMVEKVDLRRGFPWIFESLSNHLPKSVLMSSDWGTWTHYGLGA